MDDDPDDDSMVSDWSSDDSTYDGSGVVDGDDSKDSDDDEDDEKGKVIPEIFHPTETRH